MSGVPSPSAGAAIRGVVVRDLQRTLRQRSRLLGGIARPLLWLLLVGTGYGAIARLEGGVPYRAYVFPGVVVMAALFGAMLTAIGTVYDREFGMLRLMLASPAGVGAVLAGRTVAAAAVGLLQGAVVLVFAPLALTLTPAGAALGLGALAVSAAAFASLGLLVAARLRSVENFAGIINVVLFPLLFASGALYPVGGMPRAMRLLARANPVTYAVDLVRQAMGLRGEWTVATDLAVLAGAGAAAFILTALLFDPEQRLIRSRDARAA
jgi:ABC-2 type transport system permease protein